MLGSGLSCRVMTGLCVVLRVVLRVRQIVFPRAVLPLVAYGVPRGRFPCRFLFCFYEL